MADGALEETERFEGVFRQGFLCAFCLLDLGNMTDLHVHVEKYHPEASLSDKTLDSLKGWNILLLLPFLLHN